MRGMAGAGLLGLKSAVRFAQKLPGGGTTFFKVYAELIPDLMRRFSNRWYLKYINEPYEYSLR